MIQCQSFTAETSIAQNISGLDICIPVFRHDPTGLILDLARQHGADHSTLLIYDDGSGDCALTARIMAALEAFPGQSRLITASANHGRSAARNALIAASSAAWLLFLDADMAIGCDQFLLAYCAAAAQQNGPCCIVGGFDVNRSSASAATRLHLLQSCRSECLTAARRNADPGRFVFTSNIFLHRSICTEIPFDSGFHGWGWEDVEWGLTIMRRYPILHIDNVAIHLGLDPDRDLLRKYEGSGPNFMLLLARHPDSVKKMQIYRIANLASHMPMLGAWTWLSRQMVLTAAPVLPAALRLYALKVFRALIYARELHAQSH
ncbi:glycosyltransferase family 2 protein [Paracoccus sp. (in: a-proteobacteria)]|uniref:glycosyltransferase family 2 protein n=1 Tax=Paracoccus sp. TaxID=267 RepID=UPI00289BDC9A|nr:glycosyltransferase [Paracoccus sp. (in: a-proteobacteria)]